MVRKELNSQSGTISASANLTALNLDNNDGYCVQMVLTASGVSGCSYKLQGSVDGTTFIDIDSTIQSFTDSVNILIEDKDPKYLYVRGVITIGSGSVTYAQKTLIWE